MPRPRAQSVLLAAVFTLGLGLLGLLILAAGCGGAGAPPAPAAGPGSLAITGVTVVSMDPAAPPAESGRTVVVADGRIAAVGAAGEVAVPAGAEVIDGSGRWLLPGLWDMHVHALYPGYVEHVLELLVAHGITGARDMNGPMPLAEVARLKRQIAAGERLGPRLVAPGPLLDGPGRSPDAQGDQVVEVADPAAAAAAVQRLAGEGADFIKVYNRLTPELLAAVIGAARTAGLAVDGHVPLPVPTGDAADLGMRTIEHLQGVLEDASPAGEALRRAMAGLVSGGGPPTPEQVASVMAGRARVVDDYTAEGAAALIERFVAAGTWHCPTLVSNRGLLLPGSGEAIDAAFAGDPRLRFVPASLRPSWEGDGGFLPDPEARRRRWELLLEVTGDLHRAGVPLLAGTDVGVPHVVPGGGLHDELALLVEAGLTPWEALATATRNPARLLGLDDELGSVVAGKTADLLLLDADPLADIDNVRRIAGVFLAGRHLDRQALDRLLARAEERAGEI